MKITFLGHSACLVETRDHHLLIDPFITGNSMSTFQADDISCDFILLTHGHADHFGDTEALAKRNDATVIANFELAGYCETKGLKNHPMHIGGSASFPFGEVKLTIAHHGSSLPGPDGLPIYLGEPAGILIKAEGKTIYHAGDTGLFLDMQLIGQMNTIDVALLPIGDNFTMGPEDALKAIEFLRPKKVIPIHYNTFPPIEKDPNEFAQAANLCNTEAIVLESGQSIEV